MNIIQPSRLTFWRSVFALTAALAFLSMIQILGSGAKLGVDFSVSRAWMGLVGLLGLSGLFSLIFFALTWSRYREPLLSVAEFPEQRSNDLRWISLLLLTLAVTGYSLLSMLPFFQEFFGGLGWARFLIFWGFSLIGLWGIKWFRRDTPWFIALMAIVLCQSTLHLLLVYWPRVTDYPFAHGMVGNEPLLLSLPLSFGQSIWTGISMANFASYVTFASCAPLLIRRPALGASSLAGGDPICFGRSRCPGAHEAAFGPGTSGPLAGRLMDVPVFVHGTDLFSPDYSRHTSPARVFLPK